LLVGSSPILAQTTIFNVPSTDVLLKKLFYVEADFTAHLDKFSKGGFQTFGYKTVYGVRKNLEVGANFFYTRLGGITAPKEFQQMSNGEPTTTKNTVSPPQPAQSFLCLSINQPEHEPPRCFTAMPAKLSKAQKECV